MALFAYAWAKHNNGKFILRLEDTDRTRFVKTAGEQILELLREFGLNPDYYPTSDQLEAMEKGQLVGYGADWALHLDEIEKVEDNQFSGVYVQTQRLPLYQKYAWQLVKNGYAYFCFCSKERLEQVNKERLAKGLKPGYDGYCKLHYTLDEALEKIKKGEPYVVRMDTSAAERLFGSSKITVHDKVLGELKFDFKDVNDQVLIKSDGIPTYHLAVVVDDYLMGVTHMMRGYEWISSTPKQVFIYKALGWDMPEFVHLPLILDPGGGKLSKRKGSVMVAEFLKEGYLKDALLNFLMLLGWSPGKGDTREFFTLDEFVSLFDIDKINKANPVFDRNKLLWFNGEYIRKKDVRTLTDIFTDWVRKYCDDVDFKKAVLKDSQLDKKMELVKPRIKLLSQAVNFLKMFYFDPEFISPRQVKGVKRYECETIARALIDYFNYEDLSSNEAWVASVRRLADAYDIKHADMFMALRLAVAGNPVSVPLYEAFVILGKDKVRERINRYAERLKECK